MPTVLPLRPVLEPLPPTTEDDAAPVVFVTNALRPRGLRARAEKHRPVLAVVLR